MIDIKRLTRGSGYAIEESDYDTTNIICYHGHIYADGDMLVAAMDSADRSQSIRLRRLGDVVADGDLGELSVRFHPSRLGDVARILKPRQAVLLAAA